MQHVVMILHIMSIAATVVFVFLACVNPVIRGNRAFRSFMCVVLFLSVHNALNAAVYYNMHFSLGILPNTFVIGSLVAGNLMALLYCAGRLFRQILVYSVPGQILYRGNTLLALLYGFFALVFPVLPLMGVDLDSLTVIFWYDTVITVQFFHLLFFGCLLTVLLYIPAVRKQNDEHLLLNTILNMVRIPVTVFLPGLTLQIIASVATFSMITSFLDVISLISLPVFLSMLVSLSMAAMLSYHEPVGKNWARMESFGLTKRELEVVQEMIRGYSYNDIANNLYISIQTVKSHLNSVYRKTGTKNKVALYNLLIDS